MKLETEAQLWTALFESDEKTAASETVAWLMSGPDSHFVQLLATYCERDQLVELVCVTRHTLRQLLNAEFAPLRDYGADGSWRRGVQRAIDELFDLRPDLLNALTAQDEDGKVRFQEDAVVSELSKAMGRKDKELNLCA